MNMLEANELAKPLSDYLFDKFYSAQNRYKADNSNLRAKAEMNKYRHFMNIVKTLKEEVKG